MRNPTAFMLTAIVVPLCAGHASGEMTFGPRRLVVENAWAPCISADELSLYFCAVWDGGYGGLDIYVMTRPAVDAPWGEPANLGAAVNTEYCDANPIISANGLELIFCDTPLFGGLRPGGLGGGDLWVSTRAATGLPWGEPVNLGATVNSEQYDWGSCVSSDGGALYFDSTRPGGQGAFDLWRSTRTDPSDPLGFGPPVNVGTPVNTPGAEEAPSISTDGLILMFHGHREGSPEGDPGDIWMTTRASIDDDWDEPVLLSPPVHTLGWEAYPSVSADFPEVGSSLYFMHNPTDNLFGKWDIYESVVVPEPSTLLMLPAVGIAWLLYARPWRKRNAQ